MKIKVFVFILIIGILSEGNIRAQGFSELSGTLLPVSGNSKISAGDLNNDGLIDLVIAGKDNTKSFAKGFQNNADSTFIDLGLGLPALTSYALTLCDLNNDEWLDILLSGVNASNDPEFHIYINQKNGTFNSISHTIPGLRYGHIECKDIDLDGYSDIFVTGLSDSGNYTAIFKNNGDLTFSKANQTFQGVYDGGSILTDLNNDGYPDIFYAGLNSSFIEKSFLFLNDGDFKFTERSSDIPGIRSGNVETADINNDGYTDIAVFGNDENNNYILKIYKNNFGSSFTLLSDLQGIVDGSIKFGDFNADGYADLLTTGKIQSGSYKTVLYNNNSGTSFTDNGIVLTGLYNSDCQWLDLNNDHKPDFIISGYELAGPTIELHSSDELTANQIPSGPLNLTSETDGTQVSLNWEKSTDNEQDGKGLSYELNLINSTSNNYIFYPNADTSSGYRRLVKRGAFEDTSCLIRNITEGKYHWSVQSVDAAFEGSPFAKADTFYISEPIDLGNDTIVCYGDTITFSLLTVNGNFKWYHSLNPSVPTGTSKEIDIKITQKDTIWLEVTKSYGTIVYDTIIVDINPLPSVNLGDDITICYGDNIDLSMGTATDSVNWSTLSGTYTELDVTNFTKSFNNNDEIYVELTDANACVNNDTISITVNSLPVINLVNDTTLCLNNSLQLNLGTVTDSINWYSLSSSIESLNSNTFEYLVSQNEIFRIEWYDQNRCVNNDTITVTARSLPIPDAGVDKLICEGYSTTIGPETTLPNWSYLWFGVGITNGGNTANPTVQAPVETKYFLTVTDEYKCTGSDSMRVNINPVGSLNAGSSQEICIGQSVSLGGSPTATGSILPYSYKWNPSGTLDNFESANPIASPTETTTYSIIIYTGNCPVDTLQTELTVHPLPLIEIMNDTVAGFEEDMELWALGGINYSWTPTEYLNNPLSQNPVANLEQTMHFTVGVTDTNNCTDTSGVTIFIKNEIFIPELFTPNNDDSNDFFKVYGFGIKELRLVVFNKYGNVVFESNILDEIFNAGWNGEDKGHPVENGKYFWKITGEFYSGEQVLFNGKDSGIITILR